MRFTITGAADHVRGDLYERRTIEETRRFLDALAGEALRRGTDLVLISVHSSAAIFRTEQFGLPAFLDLLASRPAHRIALVADTWEVQLAHQYVAMLARLRGLTVRSFRNESEASAWLRSESAATDGRRLL